LAEWRAAGVFEQLVEILRSELPRPETGYLDATFVRSRGGGSEAVGLTRHGKGSKLQVIVDSCSRPIAFLLVSANPSESRTVKDLFSLAGVKIPLRVVADRAYDADSLRDLATETGSVLVAPHRRRRVRPARDQELIPTLYRERWRVERLFAWLAGWRRIATRWERSLANYRSWLCLALSLIYSSVASWGFCP